MTIVSRNYILNGFIGQQTIRQNTLNRKLWNVLKIRKWKAEKICQSNKTEKKSTLTLRMLALTTLADGAWRKS